jgi:hypothetical protein
MTNEIDSEQLFKTRRRLRTRIGILVLACIFAGLCWKIFYPEFRYAQNAAKQSRARAYMRLVAGAIASHLSGEERDDQAARTRVISELVSLSDRDRAQWFSQSWPTSSVGELTPRIAASVMRDPFGRRGAQFHIFDTPEEGIIILSVGPNGVLDSTIDGPSPQLIRYDVTNGCYRTAGDLYMRLSAVAASPG